MKRSDDPRHKKREQAVQQLFSYSYQSSIKLGDLATKVIANLSQTDSLIESCAKEWPIQKINKIDLAVLRLALTELLTTKTPQKVIIDEAVELSKTFGSEASPSFVNGVLGSALKLIKVNKEEDTKKSN